MSQFLRKKNPKFLNSSVWVGLFVFFKELFKLYKMQMSNPNEIQNTLQSNFLF